MKNEKGLLAKADVKKGQQIPENLRDWEHDFYPSNDFTTMCPVKKILSVSHNNKKVHQL